jgi:hypothetical protein
MDRRIEAHGDPNMTKRIGAARWVATVLVALGSVAEVNAQAVDRDFERSIRVFYTQMSSSSSFASKRALSKILPTETEFQQLFPKDAARLWPKMSENFERLQASVTDMAARMKGRGRLASILGINLRTAYDPTGKYKAMIAALPSTVSAYRAVAITSNSAESSGVYFYVNRRWVWIEGAEGLSDLSDADAPTVGPAEKWAGVGTVKRNAAGGIISLSIVSRKITPEVTKSIEGLRFLRSLTMRACNVSDTDLVALGRLVRLVELNISDNPAVTDKGLAHLSPLLLLKQLNLEGTGVVGTGLTSLTNLRQLEQLSLRGTRIGSSSLISLVRLKTVKQLFLGGKVGTDLTIGYVKRMPGLERLTLSDTMVSGQGLLQMKDAKRLVFVDATGSSRITATTAQAFVRVRPDVKLIGVVGLVVAQATPRRVPRTSPPLAPATGTRTTSVDFKRKHDTTFRMTRLKSNLTFYAARHNDRYPPSLAASFTGRLADKSILRDAWGEAFVYHASGRKRDPFDRIPKLLISSKSLHGGQRFVLLTQGFGKLVTEAEFQRLRKVRW